MYFFFIKYCDFLVVAWRLVGVKWEKLLNLTKKKRKREQRENDFEIQRTDSNRFLKNRKL